MPEIPRPRPLPTENEYETAVTHVETILRSSDHDAEAYLRLYARSSPSLSAFADMAVKIGILTEPVDQWADRQSSGNAFMFGSLSGLMTAKKIHQHLFPVATLFDTVPRLGTYESGPPEVFRHTYMQQLIEYGHSGMGHIGVSAAQQVEQLGEQIIPSDTDRQRLFISAFGIVAMAAYESHLTRLESWHDENMDEISSALARPDAIDWDSALKELRYE
jgi:hypothetical protein